MARLVITRGKIIAATGCRTCGVAKNHVCRNTKGAVHQARMFDAQDILRGLPLRSEGPMIDAVTPKSPRRMACYECTRLMEVVSAELVDGTAAWLCAGCLVGLEAKEYTP